ncbi:AAA family ATPase [Lysinibacillus irui]|uniref:AAA family ATPase n=1 Tax=Lysinibacillus irui TaxID=2998077 RepID=UPI003D28205D
MLINELKEILNLDDKEFNMIVEKFKLENMKEIDDTLANEIINRLKIKEKYKNNSSLKGVKIFGLFNKYDYEINFDDKINIFVAENGHGKTTIMKLLVAALNRDTKTLNQLPYKKIELIFDNNKKAVLKKNINFKTRKNINFSQLDKLIDIELMLSKKNLPKILKEVYFNNDEILYREEIRRHVALLKTKEDFNTKEIKEAQKFLNHVEDSYIENYSTIIENLREEIKYLPTFRRVEAEIREIYDEEFDEVKLNDSNLKFGLKDVELRINKLTNQLTKEAFEIHSKINGEILGDLLSDTPLTITDQQRAEITKGKMQIIIGRIGKENIKEYDKLNNFLSNIEYYDYSNNKDFLQYYIYKLMKIYDSQRDIDDKIKEFRDVCNKYLINKELIYDEISPELTILDKEDGSPITFSELSSGEKQILSIFSELYLEDTQPMIYIIDEPELSLSIKWQKNILEDIYNSGKVSLLISTTHSPFIFKNTFQVFAKDLNKFKKRTYYTKKEDI